MTNEEVLNTFANKMLTAAEGIEQFGKEQLPDYIEQVLSYHLTESYVFLSFGIILSAISLGISWYCFKRFNEEDSDEMWMSSVILSGIVAIAILAGGIAENVPTILKINLAPKVYLVDYIRN